MRIDFQKRLDDWRKLIDQELSQHPFQASAAYLDEPCSYALNAQGKRLRPALCLASAEAVSGDWESAVPAALALEVFHTSTLVHDDIMDQDDLRRGQPTVHKTFDVNRALIAGDAILIHSYDHLNRIDRTYLPRALRMFNEAALDVCRGQAWDMQFEAQGDVTLADYQRMIDQKTGALLRLSGGLGALVVGATQDQIDHLMEFGLLIGRAFQLQDDLLEVTSNAGVMGKSLGSDLVNEKKTWLWLDLQEQLDEAGRREWARLLAAPGSLEEKRDIIRGWMSNHGTLQRASEQVNTWIHEAEQRIRAADLVKPEMLQALADLILNRRH